MKCDDANANQLACGGQRTHPISLRAQHQQRGLTDRALTTLRGNRGTVVPSTDLKIGDGCCPPGLSVLTVLTLRGPELMSHHACQAMLMLHSYSVTVYSCYFKEEY